MQEAAQAACVTVAQGRLGCDCRVCAAAAVVSADVSRSVAVWGRLCGFGHEWVGTYEYKQHASSVTYT
jgi:hypothetical protein